MTESKSHKAAREAEEDRIEAGLYEPEPVSTPPTDEPEAISETDYLAQKADLEQQLADLELKRAKAEIVPYPAWRYHATQGARIVNSLEESDALGAGWQPTPILPPESPEPPPPEPSAAS